MIAKILQRMNRRERILAGAVALVVFFLANLFVWSWLFRAAGDSRVEVVTRKQKHAEQTVLLRETDLWTNRDKWLREHQPAFHGASDASALLDQLKQVASKYSVLIENPAIGPSQGQAITNPFRYPSKRKVNGRRWFIFFTMSRRLMGSWFLRAQILRLIRVTRRRCVVNLRSPAGTRPRPQ